MIGLTNPWDSHLWEFTFDDLQDTLNKINMLDNCINMIYVIKMIFDASSGCISIFHSIFLYS